MSCVEKGRKKKKDPREDQPLSASSARCFEFFPFHCIFLVAFRDQVFVPYNNIKENSGLFKFSLCISFPTTYYPRHPADRLCLDESTADLSTTLAGREVSLLTLDNVGALLDDFLTLGKDELDVARVGHVGVDL